MTDEQIITDICPYQGECSVSGCKRNDDGCFVRQLFEERDRAEKLIIELNETIQAKEQECEELKQTLTKIKDIAKKTLNMVDYKTYFKRDNKSLKQEGFKTLNEILQKISEVTENENS